MTTTYTQFTQQTASKKITLVHLDMKREVKVFTTVGTIHTRAEDFFVTEVLVNGADATFTFTPSTKELSVTFDGDIAAQEVIVTYRLFLSDYDVIASHDLTVGGDEVMYTGLVKRIPGFSTALNFASSNKTVIGTGSLSLDNSTGFFNELLSTYRFENKEFTAYSWSPTLAINEHKIIYRGTTEQASISGDNLNFRVKDSIFSLNNQFPLTQFSENEVIERDRSNFKKSVFGRVNGMRVQSISQNGDGYPLTGTISGDAGTLLINGTNTIFLQELVPQDRIVVNGITLTIRRVINDLSLLVTAALDGTITNGSAVVRPAREWYNRNRTYSVANHALKQFSTTINGFIDLRRLIVADSNGFEARDTVLILNEAYVIDRVSKVYTDDTNTTTNDVIVLERTLSSNNLPVVGDTVNTQPVSNLQVAEVDIIDSNISISNADNTETTITLSNSAEQDAATEGVFGNDITHLSGTNYFVAGTPSVQLVNVGATSTSSYLGIHVRLSKEDDTTPSGDFIWFGPEETIREFTTTAAALVNFVPGDLYLNTTDDEYIGIKTTGTGPRVDGTDSINLGSEVPTRVQISDDETTNFNLISNKLEIALVETGSIWLMNTEDPVWKLFTNQGINIISNTVSFPVGFSPTISSSTGARPATEISLSESVGPRDLIRVDGVEIFSQVVQSELTFVQVAEITNELADITATGFFKNPVYATDTGLVTLSAFGQTFNGTIAGNFVKTPADACQKILQDNGLTDFLDNDTFTSGSTDEDFSIGMYIPFRFNGKPPSVLDMINIATLTGLSSVGLNSDFALKYQLLNGFKPTTLDTIRVIRNNEVMNRADENLYPSPLFRYTIRNIDASYDFGEAEPNEKLIRLEDEKIGRLTDLATTEEVDLYTGDLTRATNIADRFLNYSQRFNRVVGFRGSLSLSDINIGDVVLLDLLELRNLSDNNIPFIGMVTQFNRDGKLAGMTVEDLGGLFVRAAGCADDTSDTYTNSNSTDQLLGTFLTDNNGIINNEEQTLGTNILV